MENKELKSKYESTLDVLRKLNEVPGFCPETLCVCYADEQEERMYLPADAAMMWFRLAHPNGKLEQLFVRGNDNYAVVEGRVYDENGSLLANAFVTRWHTENSQYGADFLQNAGTSAIRKALGNAGFGTPADACFIEGITPKIEAGKGEEPVDSGKTVKLSPPPAPQRKKRSDEKKENAEDDIISTQSNAAKESSHGSPENEAPAAPAPVPAPVQKPVPAPIPTQAPAVVKDTPFTMEDAMAFVVPGGRYAGKTFKEIIDGGDMDAIKYFLRPVYQDKPIYRAAAMVAGQYGL